VWRHIWRKNWVNYAVLTGNSACLTTVLSSRLSCTELRSSLRESHSFLNLPVDTTIAESHGTQQNRPKNWQPWWETCTVPENTLFSFSCCFLIQFNCTVYLRVYGALYTSGSDGKFQLPTTATGISGHFSTTLTEIFPCFILSCKANSRAQLAKTGHGPHFPNFYLFFVMYVPFSVFCVLFVCKCVLDCCHRVSTQFQLNNNNNVERMDSTRLPKIMIHWEPEGMKKRGRPRRTWKEGIYRAMKERHLRMGEWNNRRQWRIYNTLGPRFTNLIRSWRPFVNLNVRKPKLFFP
jgi:hypothetical protein